MTSCDKPKLFIGKRVLVCGASGMTGHNLFDYLLSRGVDVTGTCLLRRSVTTHEQYHFVSVDFTDKQQAEDLFSIGHYDYVFICCAQSYNATVCANEPQRLIQPNLEMVSNILSSCLKYGVQKVLFMSSATVYQPHSSAISEKQLDLNKDPHALYFGIGWVKRYLEKLCEFYSKQGLITLIVRPTNIYGIYDKVDPNVCHVIPALIMRALNKESPFILRTNGTGVKNFIHVNDLVRDMVKLMAISNESDVYNITSDTYNTISNVCTTVIGIVREMFPEYNPPILYSDVPDAIPFVGLKRDKFDENFLREPYTPLTTGLKDVVKWYSSLLPTQKS